jgi:acetyl esterase/lipase
MKASLLLSALFAAMLLAGAARAESGKPYEVRELRNVAYFDGKGADFIRHKLDVFVPVGKKDYPVVVLVHGGAWMIGDKSCCGLYSAVGRFLASQGVGAVLPNYRLSPWVKHPEHVRDVARAFAWTHRHIAEYGGDPDKLFIAGHSAGGHLAALLATDEQYLKAEGMSRKDVRGVIAVSGVYRVPDKVVIDFATDGLSVGQLPVKVNPFDLVFARDSAGRRDASPVCHVCADVPPCLLVNADHDLPLLPEMAEEFAAALKEKNCQVEAVTVKGRNHNNILFNATRADDPVAKAVLDFIARHSGK